MSAETGLLTIKQFAEMVGISQQAIYKQLNNKLKPFLKIDEKGQKWLEIEGLRVMRKDDTTQPNIKKVEQPLNTKVEQQFNTILAEKDKQILQLQDRISSLENLLDTVNENNERLLTILQQQQIINQQLTTKGQGFFSRVFRKKNNT